MVFALIVCATVMMALVEKAVIYQVSKLEDATNFTIFSQNTFCSVNLRTFN